jgi:outer membrane receptor for ferrienterochelin and colicins
VVVDGDASLHQLLFYNLSGKSYSNSLQAELNYSPLNRLDVRLAYRWLDVRTGYHGNLLQKPLTARDRGFVNLAYATAYHWKFDLTAQMVQQKTNTLYR